MRFSQQEIGFKLGIYDLMLYLNYLKIDNHHKYIIREMAGEKRKRGEDDYYELAILARKFLTL